MLPTNIVQYLAQNFSASITSASRPALTFFVIQFSVFVSAAFDWLIVDPNLDWMVHPGTLAAGGIFAILEGLAQHDEDIAMLMHDFHVHKIVAALGTFSSALLFSSLGLPSEEALQVLGAGAVDSDLVESTKVVVQTYAGDTDPNKLQIGAVSGAVVSNVGITYARGYLHEYFDDLDILPIWQKIETGGVAGALILLLFAPVLCLIFLLSILTIGAILGFIIKSAQKMQDEMARYACPHCEHRVRQEAILCSSCHNELQPIKILASDEKRKKLVEQLFPKSSELPNKATAG